MPINVFTTCADPDTARPHEKLGGLAGLLVNSWLNNGFLTLAAIFTIIGISSVSSPALCVEAILVIIALKAFKRWYYHERLLCLQKDQCAIGTVVSPTVPAAFDGDIKLNLLLAPYMRTECEDILLKHLENNKGMLSDPVHPIWNDWWGGIRFVHDSMGRPIYLDSTGREMIEDIAPGSYVYVDTGLPVPPSNIGTLSRRKTEPVPPPTNIFEVLDDSSRGAIQDYMDKLKGIREDAAAVLIESNAYNQVTLGVVDTLLQDSRENSNDRIVDAAGNPISERANYQQHYYRKSGLVGLDVDTLDKIPTDFGGPIVDWQSSNAHSTHTEDNPQTGGENESLNPMFRFGHKDEDADKSVAMVPYLHCEIEGNALEISINRFIDMFTGFIIGCVVIGGALGVAVGGWWALLILFFLWLYDKIAGNDGNADEPDVRWDDPFASGGPQESGQDTVAVWGDWIMDTEHQQWFEIHPVRAYYILERHSEGGFPDFAGKPDHDEFDSRKHTYPIEQVTKTVWEAMCADVGKNEPPTPPEKEQTIKQATGLSYGMTTQYGMVITPTPPYA